MITVIKRQGEALRERHPCRDISREKDFPPTVWQRAHLQTCGKWKAWQKGGCSVMKLCKEPSLTEWYALFCRFLRLQHHRREGKNILLEIFGKVI